MVVSTKTNFANFESSAYTCSFYGTRCPRLEGNLRRVEKFLERCNRKSIAREELVVVDKEDIIELMRYSFQEELEFVKNNYAK
jgi:hypothetical protein